MTPIRITIHGKPQHKRRPRFSSAKGFVRTHSDPKQKQAEMTIQAIAQQHKPKSGLLAGPLTATLYAYFAIPKSTSKKRKRMMAAGAIYPTVKPDADNIAKIYLDALNGIIYGDDKQIVQCSIHKRYAADPRVEIIISEAYKPEI